MLSGKRGSPERCALRIEQRDLGAGRGRLDGACRKERAHGLVEARLLLLHHLREDEAREGLGDGSDLEERVGLRRAVAEDAPLAVREDADRDAPVGRGGEVAARERRGEVGVEDGLELRESTGGMAGSSASLGGSRAVAWRVSSSGRAWPLWVQVALTLLPSAETVPVRVPPTEGTSRESDVPETATLPHGIPSAP